MKRTIRPLYFDSIRPGALEGYLEYMAQRGWRLRKICCGFGLFDAAAPQNTRYRVENVQSEQEEIDDLTYMQKDFYQECGWEYLHCMGAGQYLFRADDPDVPEFHTDHEIEADTYRELLRREKRWLRINTVIMVAWLAMILAIMGYECNRYGFWGSWIRLAQGRVSVTLWLLTFAICLIQLVLRGRRIARLSRLIADGRLEQERAGWRAPRGRRIAGVTAWCLCVISLFAGAWWMDENSGRLVRESGLPVVSLAEIEGQEEDTSEWVYFPIGFTRRYYNQRETIVRGEDELDILLAVEYYELYDWMPAEAVTEAIADQTIGLKADEDMQDNPQFDQFYCDRMGEGDYVALTARRGNRVMSLLCIGGDRERAIDLVTVRLNKD
ncbi:DUF2812 domain-containing protein [Butyricicoccus pullicaecorum]|uniref:DUF2812 domain-containing protein n=1 Tax=Butyricicoccus pullicaecorum TaxID=501571 RepID=UPI003990A66E